MRTSPGTVQAPSRRPSGHFSDYVKIARLDHGTKHIFIIPGVALACLLRGRETDQNILSIMLGLVVAVCIASANYVINEWLDRDFDRHHPTKSRRSAVQRELRGGLILIEWLLFVGVGLAAAAWASMTMFVVAVLFAAQGIIYNVPPIRTKNLAYLDVMSEAVNNPFRLMIGWTMIDPTTLPPASIVLAYWLGGAFLMGAKRLSEYRQIVASHGKDLLVRYRQSFAGYSEVSLTVSCFIYAMLSSFFLAVFLMKYRIEYIYVMPFVVAIFGQYLALSMKTDSSAQHPEKLFKEKDLIMMSIIVALMFVIATVVNMPWLDKLTTQSYISVKSVESILLKMVN